MNSLQCLLFRCLLFAGLLAFAPSVRAHPGHFHPGIDEVDEFEKQHALNVGLLHPLTGLDHLLPLLAMGCAAGLTGRARILMVSAFVSGAFMGGNIATGGFALPGHAAISVFCVLAAGLSTLLTRRSSQFVIVCLVTLFGFWQGNAHALLIPARALHLSHGAGFIATSAFILGTGMVLRTQLRRFTGRAAACPAPSV